MTFNHGTTNGYTNHRCRCDLCRVAVRVATQERKKAKALGLPEQCEACGFSGELQWDHDHGTVKHRGWLCRDCNRALGMFQDNRERLLLAIDYLEGTL